MHMVPDYRKHASADFARGIAVMEFMGVGQWHPRQWDKFVDRRPQHIDGLNSHGLRRIATHNERLRRQRVADSLAALPTGSK